MFDFIANNALLGAGNKMCSKNTALGEELDFCKQDSAAALTERSSSYAWALSGNKDIADLEKGQPRGVKDWSTFPMGRAQEFGTLPFRKEMP